MRPYTWRQLPSSLSGLAVNPKEPKKLDPWRMKCSCGSTTFYVINEKRPYKRRRLEANRRRHRVACVSCSETTEIFEA